MLTAAQKDRYLNRQTEGKKNVWGISLTGGDQVLLSEDEAQGYYGPGIYFTTND